MTRAERLAIELGAPIADRDGAKLVPMLCGRDESGERVLAREGWIFELKLDGVRILADKRGDRVSLGYRKMRSATESYPEIAEAVARLSEERVLLDGEDRLRPFEGGRSSSAASHVRAGHRPLPMVS